MYSFLNGKICVCTQCNKAFDNGQVHKTRRCPECGYKPMEIYIHKRYVNIYTKRRVTDKMIKQTSQKKVDRIIKHLEYDIREAKTGIKRDERAIKTLKGMKP